MKKILTTIGFLYSLSSLAQITIGNIEQQAAPVAPKPKPKVLDSLSDFKTETDYNNYSQYIGYQFYLPPKIKYANKSQEIIADENKVKLYATYPIIGNDPYNNYYKVIGLIEDNKLNSLLKNNKIYYYHTVNDDYKYSYYPSSIKRAYFIFRNEKDNDTLYWAPTYNSEFILVPYFVKQKSLYEKKIFYYVGAANNINDVKNNNIISLIKNSKWTCKEVTLLENEHYTICYVFTNDKNETFVKTSNPFYPEVRDSRAEYAGKSFITEKEFLENEQAKKIQEQTTKLKNEARDAKHIQDKKAEYQEYIKKYGQANADLISNGKVKIGMTQEMCIYAWGPFYKTSKVINEKGSLEMWAYSIKQVLYFKDGILIQIEQ